MSFFAEQVSVPPPPHTHTQCYLRIQFRDSRAFFARKPFPFPRFPPSDDVPLGGSVRLACPDPSETRDAQRASPGVRRHARQTALVCSSDCHTSGIYRLRRMKSRRRAFLSHVGTWERLKQNARNDSLGLGVTFRGRFPNPENVSSFSNTKERLIVGVTVGEFPTQATRGTRNASGVSGATL